jgi:hypothetical protein
MTESNQVVKKNNSRKIKDLRPPMPKSLIFKKFSKTVILLVLSSRSAALKRNKNNLLMNQ